MVIMEGTYGGGLAELKLIACSEAASINIEAVRLSSMGLELY